MQLLLQSLTVALSDTSNYAYRSMPNLESPRAWNGTRHEYRDPHTVKQWNLWRSLRVLLSRSQEAIFRRSWPTLTQAPPPPHHYRTIRAGMATDICVAAASVLGASSTSEQVSGSISRGYGLIYPLCLAGTCLLESLAEPTVSPGGSHTILVSEPLHTDPLNHSSTQLAGVIARLDYIEKRIGIRWAASVSRFLRGQTRIFYDLGRT